MSTEMSGDEAYVLLLQKIKELQISGGVITDYKDLSGKPIVNGVTLAGSLSLEDLGIEEISNIRIDQIIQSIGGL